MNELDNFGLKNLSKDELIKIDGGSELSDWLMRGIGKGWAHFKNFCDDVKEYFENYPKLVAENGGLPHAY
ncbi:hypothetical protein [Porphyromonas sp.]|uniref:hypothetical protein n=1 Tax=Porphyromonas sp. TaxID=1924944 RepID=UPI0026DC67D4|nr:hypothetical protein [Porphyromonas sp.]MDO4695748.1 hypothetical protein [Porphyromonas sp.]MDO4771767.1 hypothetical protein [Porphyromonas sp.]